eukprot:TRINITY_DN48682_c0_g1_i1.p1 TRINITY_DN48682_c0_g1~~TRINITY_DN48682_c0_g1_i1.p1  ORF type:complete len:1726 (+),score=392.71 TRINITY_DN48682_c0_g1_i1:45-5180(+)
MAAEGSSNAQEVARLLDELTNERTACAQSKSEAAYLDRETSVLKGELDSRAKELERVHAKAVETTHLANEEISSLKAERTRNHGDLSQSRSEFTAASREITIMKAELDAKTSEVERVHARLVAGTNSANEETERLQNELLQERGSGTQFRADAAALSREISILKVELEGKCKDIERMHSKAVEGSSGAKEELSRLQADLMHERSSLAQVRVEAASTVREMAVLNAELEAKAKECERLHAKIVDDGRIAQEDVLRLQSDLTQERSLAAQSKSEAASLSRDISIMKAEIEAKSKETERLHVLHSKALEDVNVGHEEIARLESELKKERNAIAQAKAEVASGSRDVALLKVELEAKTRECERLHAKVSEGSSSNQDEMSRLQAELKQERTAAMQAKTEMAAISRELSFMKAELEAKTRECERLHAKAVDASAAAQEELSRSQAEVVQERGVATQSRAESAALSRDLSVLKAELDAKTRECERLHLQVAESLRAAEDEAGRLQAELTRERALSHQAQSEAAAVVRDMSVVKADLASKTRELERQHAKVSELSSGAHEERNCFQSELMQERSVSSQAKVEAGAISREFAMMKTEMQSKISEHERAQARLKEAISTTQEELHAAQRQLSEERSIATQAKSEGAAASREAAVVRAELDAKAMECRRLNEKVAESSGITVEEFRRLQTQLDDERTATTKARSEIATLSHEISNFRADLEARTNECNRLRSEVSLGTSSAEEARRLQAQFDEARNTAAQSKVEVSAALRETASLRSELEAKTSQIARLRTEMSNTPAAPSEHILERIQARVDEEQQNAAQMRARYEEERNALVKCRQEGQALTHEICILRLELESRVADVSRLQAHIANDDETQLKLRMELDEECGKVRRLQAQIEDEQSKVAQQRAENESLAARNTAEVSSLHAEVEARSVECGRLRAELLQQAASAHHEGDARQLATLRAQVAEYRAELERLREQARTTVSVVSAEEERLLRSMIKDRDDAILELKTEASQTLACHSRVVEDLHAKLAENRLRERRRTAEDTADRVADLNVQMRAKANEIERLHVELQNAGAEAERLRCEARARSSQIASAEASQAANQEQRQRELHRVQEMLREREGELSTLQEQHSRCKAEIQRCETETHRMTKKLEAAQSTAEHAGQESQQLRDQIIELERRLEDARASLRAECLTRNQASAQARDAQREARSARDKLQQQASEVELALGEARKARAEVADRDIEIARLTQQVHHLEAELRQLRMRSEAQVQQGSTAVRRSLAEIGEREQIIIERENSLRDREQLIQEAESMLALERRKDELRADMQRGELQVRSEIHKSEVAGLKRAVNELAAQLPCEALLTGCGGYVGYGDGPPVALEATPSAQADDCTARVVGSPSVTDGFHASRPPVDSSLAEDEAWADVVGGDVFSKLAALDGGAGGGAAGGTVAAGVPAATGCGVADDCGAAVSAVVSAHGRGGLAGANPATISEAIVALESRRRDLRRERNELEELRRQWRNDSQRARVSGAAQNQQLLRDVRSVLDERAMSVNRSIDEFRSLERALLAGTGSNLGSARSHKTQKRAPSADPEGHSETGALGLLAGHKSALAGKVREDAANLVTPRANSGSFNADDQELLRRWTRVLGSGACGANIGTPRTSRVASVSPRSVSLSAGERHMAAYSRRCRTAHDAVDRHLHFLRGLAQETSAGDRRRPPTGGGSYGGFA